MKKPFILIIFALVLFSANSQTHSLNTEQLLVVTTPDWNAITGELKGYEWRDGRWKIVLKGIRVTVGRKGLAWGKGLQDKSLMYGQFKKEGDGRSPSGIFPLRHFFGYEDFRDKVDYIKSDKNTFCVDDPSSVYYNKIVHADTVKKDWSSAEDMFLKSDSYKYGIVIGYNSEPVEPGSGSCVFMHLWSGSNSPTAGCTAMKEKDMIKLFRFLKKEKNPLIVQVPKEGYDLLKTAYLLP